MVHRAANFFQNIFLTADSADFISIFVERRMIPLCRDARFLSDVGRMGTSLRLHSVSGKRYEIPAFSND